MSLGGVGAGALAAAWTAAAGSVLAMAWRPARGRTLARLCADAEVGWPPAAVCTSSAAFNRRPMYTSEA